MTKKIVPFALMLSLGAFADTPADSEITPENIIAFFQKGVEKAEKAHNKANDKVARAKAVLEMVTSALQSKEAPASQPELTNKDL